MNRDTTIQLRHLFEIVSGSTPESGSADYWDGEIAWVTPEDVSQVDGNVLRDTRRKLTAEGFANSGTTMASAGGIVLTKRAPIGQLALLGLDACSNQGCFLLSPRAGIEPRFFYYVLANNVPLLQALGRGSTFMELSTDDLKALRVPVLAYDQQVRIANYLDASIAKVDELLQSKRGLLEILAEKRKAIIATAITRGLDPKVKLRDSGVPWLGEIPAHWQLLKFAWCVTIAEGQVDPEDDEFSAWPLIAPNHVESGTGRLLGLESAADQGAISGKYECRPGDVIYSKIRPALRKATIAPKACLCSADMYPMRVVPERLTPEYLLHYLLTDAFSVWAVLESNRVAMPKINRESLIELRMPVPPLDEQRAIVEHIARETAKLDAVRAATERTIALLKERRAALIAAAATGQLDVGAAA